MPPNDPAAYQPNGGMPPGGAPTGEPPRSLFNATDAAVMGQEMAGSDPSQMTVAEAFKQSLGIDVNSTTMAEFHSLVQKQIQGADPLGKAQQMAGGPAAGAEPPPPSGDLEALMQRMPS